MDPSYFRTIGARLVEGHLLNSGDAKGATPVVVINQTFARAFCTRALSATVCEPISPTDHGPHRVGVIADIKNGGLDKPTGTELFVPYQQTPTVAGVNPNVVRSASLLIRTKVDPLALANPVRSQVRGLDPAIAIAGLRTMDEVMSRAVSRPRFLTLPMTLFSALSMTLAALSIYGVISYTVAQRTAEIGIRMALGARRGDVLRPVGASGFRIAAAGTAAGAAGAFALTRFLSGQLFGVSALDAGTFLGMVAQLALVMLLAWLLLSSPASCSWRDFATGGTGIDAEILG